MSIYLYWSFSFALRPDLPEHVMGVLADVARDLVPGQEQLAELHPIVAYYLSDWRRTLTTESEPYFGAPIRLFGSADLGVEESRGMSIEFCQHDDNHADGGWVFWLWVLSLVRRPTGRSSARRMIGYESSYRGDHQAPRIYFVDGEGFDLGARRITFAELERLLASADDVGPGFIANG